MKKYKSYCLVLFALLLMVTTSYSPLGTEAASIKDTVFYVQFNSNGGSSVATITNIPYGTTIELPDNPTRTNYWFRGWYTDATLTTAFDPSQQIYRNITLYAKWEKYSSTPYIMSQTITDGTHSTTVTVDITGQTFGSGCQMDLLAYEHSMLQTVVYTNIKTSNYIGFELNINDYVFSQSSPLPVRIKIPSGFSTQNIQVAYTTNRKSISGIPDGYVNSSNEYVFDAYYSGTYILMDTVSNQTTTADPTAYLKISCSSNKMKINKQMSMSYQLMNYAGDETQLDFKWYSSKPYIASISKYGIVTAKRSGKTVISCVSTNGQFVATKTIYVAKKFVTSIKTNVSKKYLKKGKTFQIKTTVYPTTASIKKVKYTSSNKKIATVTSTGKVKGIKKGTCYIKVAATDGSGKYKRIKVIVY